MSSRNSWGNKKNNRTERLFSSSGVKYFNFHPKLDCIPTALLGWGLEHSVVSPRGAEGSSSRKQLQGSNINLCNVIFAENLCNISFVASHCFYLFIPMSALWDGSSA